jgi:hypothetical protein
MSCLAIFDGPEATPPGHDVLLPKARTRSPAHPTCEPLKRTQRGGRMGDSVCGRGWIRPVAATQGAPALPGSIRGVPPLRACPSSSRANIIYSTVAKKFAPCVHTGWTFWQHEALAPCQQGERTSGARPLSEISRHVYTRYGLSDNRGSKGTTVSKITPRVYTRNVISDDGDAFSSRQLGKCVEIGSRCQYFHPVSTRGTHFLTRTRLRRVPPPTPEGPETATCDEAHRSLMKARSPS